MITTSNGKSNSVNMLTLDRHPKLSTVTSLSDLRARGQGQTKVKFQTSSNGKMSSINVLALDKHQKILTVTSLSNPGLKGQRSNFTKCKLNMRLCSDLFTDLVLLLLSSVNISLTYISDMT